MAINDLTPLYEELDRATLALMNINIEKEHQMELHCEILEWGAIVLMVILVISASIIAKRIASIISKGISKPLAQLEERFETFAEGDIKSEFPTSNAQDEIAGLMNSSHDMAERSEEHTSELQSPQ